MARPEKNRKICQPPLMKGFKPFGIPLCKIEKIKLTFEEYESIRLVTYTKLSQEEAAALMNISRPTLTRIYNKALKIIAQAFIEGKAVKIINNALTEKRRICAVGTTSMRVIESAVSTNHTLNEFSGWTNKFIFPPYDFSIANCMVTNFHTPRSTLMMMVSAFAGHDFMKKAYAEAIKEKYKFYTYGDAMLII